MYHLPVNKILKMAVEFLWLVKFVSRHQSSVDIHLPIDVYE